MMKKSVLLITSIMLILSGCGDNTTEEFVTIKAESVVANTGENSKENGKETAKESIGETSNEYGDACTNSVEATNLDEVNAEHLLDMFIAGEIAANYTEGSREAFYITDLPLEVEDFNSYTIGDRVDLDNDGEKELIINGPYGGMYLGVRAGKVYVLDEGWGTAGTLSYTEFDGQTWIVHSDAMHGGRDIYDFKLYDGTGNVADEFRLSKEYWEKPEEPDGPDTVYIYRDKEITKEEYEQLKEKILGNS